MFVLSSLCYHAGDSNFLSFLLLSLVVFNYQRKLRQKQRSSVMSQMLRRKWLKRPKTKRVKQDLEAKFYVFGHSVWDISCFTIVLMMVHVLRDSGKSSRATKYNTTKTERELRHN